MKDAMAKAIESSIRHVFDSAAVLRGAISDKTKHPWSFEGELNTDDTETYGPKALYVFIC
jgi:hypothetical protein